MPDRLSNEAMAFWLVRILWAETIAAAPLRQQYDPWRKKGAEKYLTVALCERDLGTFVEPSRITIDAYFKWLRRP